MKQITFETLLIVQRNHRKFAEFNEDLLKESFMGLAALYYNGELKEKKSSQVSYSYLFTDVEKIQTEFKQLLK